MTKNRFRGALISSVLFGLTLIACSSADSESASSDTSAVTAKNLCVNQAANTFHCIDDTRFELCTGNGTFVVNSCPPGLCATRHPPERNPCVGAARATQIDGVPPTPPNQVDGTGAGNGGTSNTGSGNTGHTGSSSGGNAGSGNSGSGNTGGGKTGGGNTGQCVGGPKFDPAGAKNVGNGVGGQFIGGQCLRAADCASGCCAFPCGICSGPGAQFQAGKMGCGFGG
jgi:PPE-repeat protein